MWGICFDETADNDSLTIHEVNDALYAVQQKDPDFIWISSALTPA